MKLLRMLLLLGWVLIPGCWSLTGPDKIDGYVGGSLSFLCHYDKGYEKNTKFWCKVNINSIFNTCPTLIESDLEIKVSKGKISIKDNKEKQYFEVMMEKLRMEDAGLYRCVINRLLFDIKHNVKVTVSPAPTLNPEERLSTTKQQEQLSTTEEQEWLSTKTQVLLSTTEQQEWLSTTKDQERLLSTIDQPNPDPSIEGIVESNPSSAPSVSSKSELHILIYCIVPLLLLAAVVLIVVSRKRRTESLLPRKKEKNGSSMVSTCYMEAAHNEDPIPDHHTDADGMGLYRIVAVHPQNNNKGIHSQEKASKKKDEIPQTTLVLPDQQQQQVIYDNVDLFSHALLQPPTQEVIYTEVAKKPDH